MILTDLNNKPTLSRIFSLARKLQKHGVAKSLKISKSLILKYILTARSDRDFVLISGIRRELLGTRIYNESDGKVLYGPFEGLKILSHRWGARDLGSMILGQYERHVVEYLNSIDNNYSIFIDVGAADGFYAIGLTQNKKMDKSICFESSPEGRQSIAMNSRANKMENKVQIRGTAREDFAKELIREIGSDIDKCVFLFDIEGGEFDLLNQENLRILRNSILVIELHEEANDYENKLSKLNSDASNFFKVSTLNRKSVDPFSFKELDSWPDEDRQIIFSEGRRYAMTWLTLTPLKRHV